MSNGPLASVDLVTFFVLDSRLETAAAAVEGNLARRERRTTLHVPEGFEPEHFFLRVGHVLVPERAIGEVQGQMPVHESAAASLSHLAVCERFSTHRPQNQEATRVAFDHPNVD